MTPQKFCQICHFKLAHAEISFEALLVEQPELPTRSPGALPQSRRDNWTQRRALLGTAVEFGVCLRPRSTNDRLDKDFYLVLEDFRSGAAFRETDEGVDYRTLIADLLSGQYDEVLRIVAFMRGADGSIAGVSQSLSLMALCINSEFLAIWS
ncbi:hypothetical protein [Bradyrhizobium jicamae]|uniref:hypothetical protein n=1 Tax=Bradyrhizobium jicamae TaxID=280332 RepID=UPI001BA5CC48|nr:hypothetical protein [Bradyrhizobium jicamae]MBR0939328.1 hypothetical protein [Bradyrhizobium jicamae]